MAPDDRHERVVRTLTFWLRPEFVLRVVNRFQKVAGFDRAIALASSALTAVIPLAIFTNAIRNLQGAGSASGVAFVIGIVAAVWSSSGYVAGFMDASNNIYDVEEGRGLTKTLPVRIGLTLVLMILAGVIAFSVAISGGLAKSVGDVFGLGDTAVDVWAIAKWPVLLVLVSLLLAILYWGAPNVKVPFRLISPGSLLAVVGWVIASLLFAFYVSNFGSYNKTYGALAGPIIFLLWLWITNICVLLGAELNAQLHPAEETSA